MNGTLINSAVNSIKGSPESGLVTGSGFTPTVLYFDSSGISTNYLKTFTLNKSAELGNALNITGAIPEGTITLGTGVNLITNNRLTLKSTSAGSSRIAEIPVDGSGNALATITGKVTVERFIPSGKGWRFLGVPVKSINSPTINQAWQEGLTTSSPDPNLYPGYGVKIAGGSVANGYDQSPTTNTFIQVYNTSGALIPLPANPGTNRPLTDFPGYFLYVRGDRSVNLMQGVNAAITSTTLRVKGEINTGNKNISFGAGNFTVLSNPFPSAIDFHTVTKNNLHDVMYVWDPKLAGSYGLGGYVTESWDSATSSYDYTSSVSNITQYIPSGEAVLVPTRNTDVSSVIVKEADKNPIGFSLRASPSPGNHLRIDLFQANKNAPVSLLDGVLVKFNNINSNDVNSGDVKKIFPSTPGISLRRNNIDLGIERMKEISTRDTCFLKLNAMKRQTYRLAITMNYDESLLNAFLMDKFSTEINNTPLNMNGITEIDISVNIQAGSYASDRFYIVFKRKLNPAYPVKQKQISKTVYTSQPVIAAQTGNHIKFVQDNVKPGIYNYKIFNSFAQLMCTGKVTINSKEFSISPHVTVSGVYYLVLEGNGYSSTIPFTR